MNEVAQLGPDAARRYRDPALYDEETWGEEEIVAYYGWDLAPGFVPEGLSSGGNGPGVVMYREKATDFGGTSVVIAHCSVGHGPYDPTQKAPDGLSDRPAGYYDLYVASFRLDGAEYEVQAQRLELEEVVKIVASIVEGQAKEGAAGAAG